MNTHYNYFILILLSFSISIVAAPNPCNDAYNGLSHDELLSGLKKIVKNSQEEINLPNILNNDNALNTSQLGHIGQEILEGLNQRMIGHDDVKYAIAQAVQRAETGTNNTTKPVSSLMLLGLTGTGKSLTAEALHETLGLKPKDLIVIDSGEMQHDSDISKLTGSPAGYIGHGETPPMITGERLRLATSEKYNVNVVLIDEIEKASPALLKLLLGVLDKGRLSTGTNESIDFTKTIVIMTSNLGQTEMHNILNQKDQSFGFKSYAQKTEDIDLKLDQAVESALKKKLSPEFRNRIDKTFVFKEHTLQEARKILNMNLAKVQRDTFFKQSAVRILYNLDPDARTYILNHGYKSEFGGRSLKRAIEHMIVEPLTNLIGSHHLKPGDMISVKVTNGDLSFHKTAENISINQMEELFTTIYGESAKITKSQAKQKPLVTKIVAPKDNIRQLDPFHGLNYKQRKALEQIDKMNDYSKIYNRAMGIVENTPSKLINDIYMIELIKRIPRSNKHVATSQDIFLAMKEAGYHDYQDHDVSSQIHIIWRGLSRLEWISETHKAKLTDLRNVIDESISSYYKKKDYDKDFITAIRAYMTDLHIKVLNLPVKK